jgi:hypothetical protein
MGFAGHFGGICRSLSVGFAGHLGWDYAVTFRGIKQIKMIRSFNKSFFKSKVQNFYEL